MQCGRVCDVTYEPRPLTEYNAFRQGLMSLNGQDYEDAESHPGFLLDRIAPDATVYGWWPTEYNTPCLAWKSPRGWSATVVDNDDLGWPNSVFFVRATDLCDAIMAAAEPTSLLELICFTCEVASDPTNDEHWIDKMKGLAWGLLRLLDNDHDRRLATRLIAGLDLTGAGECLLDGDPLDEQSITSEDLLLVHTPDAA